jgi:uncharacterized membrane protein YqhA
MIQRIQSIYLLLIAVLSLGSIFILALWKDALGNDVYAIDLFNRDAIAYKSVFVLFIISGLIALTSLFSFKNRSRQILLNRLNVLINFIVLGLLMVHLLRISGESGISEKGIGVFTPLVNIILLVLATKAIQKDENLVKSAERLR